MSDRQLRELDRLAKAGDHLAELAAARLRDRSSSELEKAACVFVRARMQRDKLKALRTDYDCENEDIADIEAIWEGEGSAACWRYPEHFDTQLKPKKGIMTFTPCDPCIERVRIDTLYQTAARQMGNAWTRLREAFEGL